MAASIMFRRFCLWACYPTLLLLARSGLGQSAESSIHITMSENADGTHTSYEPDLAKRESIATTTTAKGKVLKKIIYRLDEQGRYESGRVFSANGTLQMMTTYRYDGLGRLAEEQQLDKNGALLHRIVYSFDVEGHPNGYAVYDGAGALLGNTTPKIPGARQPVSR